MVKITDREFDYLVGYLKDNFGINLEKKRILLEGRLSNYLSENDIPDFTAYIALLKADRTGKELTNLLNKVTTNHTFFMREAEHFDYLRTHALPFIERHVHDRDLRTWCAASSTGEEPYTLAMILQDYFGQRGAHWDKKLLATDLSQRVLDKAKLGIYPKMSVAELPESWQRKYFAPIVHDTDNLQISAQLRSEVVYRKFNLMDKIVAKRPFHIIFCRNVMIYFDAETKFDLVNRFYDVMAPGGYLFIGHTESIPRTTRFNYVMPSIYQKGV